ncbi:MAG: polysaccharide deacetylase family protein [Pseudomonadota bacterium]
MSETTRRDLKGYGQQLPGIRWPEGARVAVSFVVNFEEGAEFSMSEGDSCNEAVYEVTDPQTVADPCIDSHFEYGTRVGYWRVAELFGRFGVPFTLSACGRAVERSPWLAQDAVERGHEVSAHGYRWEKHLKMDEQTERGNILAAIKAIESATGVRPAGWHTRSSPSPNTRRLLVENGFTYDSDAYNDDTPYFVNVSGRRHLVLPYAFDTNDMHFQHSDRFGTGREFSQYVCDAYDWLEREGQTMPRMLSIGLHLRMIARPGRMGALEQVLQHITKSQTAWVTTRKAIAQHWITTSASQS